MRRRLLAGIVALLASPSGMAVAMETGSPPDGQVSSFAIPSQPLGDALEVYARITGRVVLYDGTLANGRRSAAVEGVHTPSKALEILLEGTGLGAEFKDAGFFVLLPHHEQPSALAETSAAGGVRPYYGRIQAKLKTAFCSRAAAAPGPYRVAARLWIDPSGRVTKEQRLASTGNAAIDRNIDETLRALHLGAPPPPGLRQPVTIVIMPRGPGVRDDCREEEVPRSAIAGGRP